MTIVLDTNAILRLVTSDVPEQMVKVKSLLDSREELTIPDVVFPEVEYNLAGTYKYTREDIGSVFIFLNGARNLKISSHVRAAIKIYVSTNLDMADCIIAAYARNEKLASFDKELIKTSGVSGYWK